MERPFVPFLYAACAIGWIGALGQIAHAVVIDDFTTGPVVVTGPAIVQQNGLDAGHVLSGSRSFNASADSTIQVAPASGLTLHSNNYGYFDVEYDLGTSGHGVDLTPEGQDRFTLRFGSSTSAYTLMALGVNLPPNAQFSGLNFAFDNKNGTWNNLILDFPFAAYSADPSAVQNIQLSAIRNPPGTSVSVVSLTTAGSPLSGDYNRDGLVNGDD